MKKLISLVAAAAMFAAVSGAAMAADNNPAVYVNSSEIFFDDQPAVIASDRTLVPARGVFEAMGAKVEWKEDARQVEVTSSDNKTLVRLTIDDKTMRVYDMSGLISTLLSGQDFEAPEKDVELDVEAQIMNDRTMVPLRAISEALNADVKWDGEAYRVDITTADAPTDKSDFVGVSISSDVTEVNEGENIDLYVSVSNMPEESYISSASVGIDYDKDNFEFVEANAINGDDALEGALIASNPEFDEGVLKVSFVTVNEETAVKTDTKFVKLTFKSVNGKEGTFAVSKAYQTRLGYNTTLFIDKLSTSETTATVQYEGTNFNVDVTPVVINAGK